MKEIWGKFVSVEITIRGRGFSQAHFDGVRTFESDNGRIISQIVTDRLMTDIFNLVHVTTIPLSGCLSGN